MILESTLSSLFHCARLKKKVASAKPKPISVSQLPYSSSVFFNQNSKPSHLRAFKALNKTSPLCSLSSPESISSNSSSPRHFLPTYAMIYDSNKRFLLSNSTFPPTSNHNTSSSSCSSLALRKLFLIAIHKI